MSNAVTTKWFVLLGAFFAFIIILAAVFVPTDKIAEPEKLIERFESMAFRQNFPPPPKELTFVRKWGGPMRFLIMGDRDQYDFFIQSVLKDVTRLTGVLIEPGDWKNYGEVDFFIFHVPEEDIHEAVLELGWEKKFTDQLSGEKLCFSLKINNSGRFQKAATFVRENLDGRTSRRCFLEQITNALGLEANSDVEPPSQLKVGSPDLIKFRLNDKIMLRTLYDPRIKPGMAKDEAMKAAAEIIPELVKAVKARGVEALYQTH